ncbi:hypothetical protein HUS23_02410 [Ectothiorhodospiraceae bacterium 2226]|nr:hypothetical protein HUS23_02410 [Ectothiorhodospiraceae bacterium 2226]
MPYLSLQTNQDLSEEQASALLPRLSTQLADLLGKPERYVMVALRPPVPMMFAGSDAPAAYLELKSIGLPSADAPALSAELCALLEETLGIPRDRVYIEFADAPRTMWGWNGRTF